MNWKTIEHVAQNADSRWYFNQADIAKVMGCGRKAARAFLVENSIPHYMIGKTKCYFLPEVIEVIEKTRWQSNGSLSALEA